MKIITEQDDNFLCNIASLFFDEAETERVALVEMPLLFDVFCGLSGRMRNGAECEVPS